MKISYFAFTDDGIKLAEKICGIFGGIVEPKENFKKTVSEKFGKCDALVFIMATGIVVRTIAPLLESKSTDPAVIVIDQKGKYVISLISGHIGGANRLSVSIAEKIGASPVITTATDSYGMEAFDEFAVKNDLVIENIHDMKYISSAMLEGKKINLVSDHDINKIPGYVIRTEKPDGEYNIVISDRIIDASYGKTVFLRPKDLVIGIGCKKNIGYSYLEECMISLFDKLGLSIISLSEIATIGLKENERALELLSEKYKLSFRIVSNDEINNCGMDFESSDFVKQVTGVPSVAESSAYIASGGGESLTGKVKFKGITMALYRKKTDVLKFDLKV